MVVRLKVIEMFLCNRLFPGLVDMDNFTKYFNKGGWKEVKIEIT